MLHRHPPITLPSKIMTENYSTQELMIIAAAREINDYERIFVGMRLPITAYGVARLTHAPNAVGLFESGVSRYEPAKTCFIQCATDLTSLVQPGQRD